MTVPVTICPTPILQFFDNSGAPNRGGSVLTQVGGINTTTYQDSAGTIPLPNPIPLNSRGEVSNASGISCQLFLQNGVAYTFIVLDVNGNQIENPPYVSATQSQSTIGHIIYPQTAAEIAAGVTPTNFAYPVGNVLRYGADPTGVADSTTAINNALAANTLVYLPGGTYFCFASLNLQSGQTFYGDGSSSVLLYTNGNISNITGNGISNAVVRDMKINGSMTGITSGIAGILLASCTNCRIERVEFTSLSYSGVYLHASQYCIVHGCYFHGFSAANQDAADVTIYNITGDATSANYNIIESNELFGGCDIGVLCQCASGTLVPSYNIVRGNRVGQHTAYGVVFYNNSVVTLDGFNTAEGNYIENIQGNPGHGAGLASGSGIYTITMGATTVVGNTIRNCCVQSTLDTLTSAAIGVGCGAGQAPFTITGNTIIDMPRFYGIRIIGAGTQGGLISANTIRVTTPNVTYPTYGIYLSGGASGICISGNTVNINNSVAGTVGIYLHLLLNATGLSITGNTVVGTSFAGIKVDQTGGFTVSYISINGNSVSGGSSSSVGLNLNNLVQGSVSGNTINCTTAQALNFITSTQTSLTGNVFLTTGTASVITAGTCTGSYFDKSNLFNGLLTNAATGLICEQLSNAVNASNSAVGDRVEQSAPAVGQPKGWRCTVAGNPGTWVSEGNL